MTSLDYFELDFRVEYNFLEDEGILSIIFEASPRWDEIEYLANRKYLRFDIEVSPCKSLSLDVGEQFFRSATLNLGD